MVPISCSRGRKKEGLGRRHVPLCALPASLPLTLLLPLPVRVSPCLRIQHSVSTWACVRT